MHTEFAGQIWEPIDNCARNIKGTRALRGFSGERLGIVRMAQEYRRYAKECLELANTFHKAQANSALIHMAQVWLRLAQKAEAQEKVSQPD